MLRSRERQCFRDRGLSDAVSDHAYYGMSVIREHESHCHFHLIFFLIMRIIMIQRERRDEKFQEKQCDFLLFRGSSLRMNLKFFNFQCFLDHEKSSEKTPNMHFAASLSPVHKPRNA